jgi:hypothetical protein
MFEIVTAPAVAQGTPSDQTFTLPEFPAHRFTESGIPIRVSVPKRGRQVPLGEEKPIRVEGDKEWYRLSHISGANRVVSRQSIRGRLFGFGNDSEFLYEIAEFPNNLFDIGGSAYRRSNRKPVSFIETHLMGEKRYRLWDAKRGRYRGISNVTLARYLKGKCALDHAYLPEDYKAVDQFPGYGFHPSGDSVVRYFSFSQNISAPRELKFSNDWSVVITDIDGHKHRLNKRQIAELAGNENSDYAPEPEPISVCPAVFTRSTDPRDLLLPQHVAQYDAEQARKADQNSSVSPVWPPHLR